MGLHSESCTDWYLRHIGADVRKGAVVALAAAGGGLPEQADAAAAGGVDHGAAPMLIAVAAVEAARPGWRPAGIRPRGAWQEAAPVAAAGCHGRTRRLWQARQRLHL